MNYNSIPNATTASDLAFVTAVVKQAVDDYRYFMNRIRTADSANRRAVWMQKLEELERYFVSDDWETHTLGLVDGMSVLRLLHAERR